MKNVVRLTTSKQSVPKHFLNDKDGNPVELSFPIHPSENSSQVSPNGVRNEALCACSDFRLLVQHEVRALESITGLLATGSIRRPIFFSERGKNS